jgi:uncharacterized protein (TIGR02145 family)
MRTKILVVLFALALSANLHAQVSIGDLTTPATGALLDLNKTTKGGLLLSNVPLENLSKIPTTLPNSFPGIVAGTNDDTNTAFTGAMVYHTGENGIPAGIYVWNGTNWTFLDENCTPLVNASQLTLTAPLLSIERGYTETFSVSSDASGRCADGETYTWSVSPGTLNTDYEISSTSGTTTDVKFKNAGNYNVTATVKSLFSPAPVSKTVSVTVIESCVPATFDLTGKVAFVNNSETDPRNGIIFSAPVKITASKTDFNAGASNSRADYRNHQVSNTNTADDTDTYGSWFTWCMVKQYADVLCPSPWRVPSASDFCKYANDDERNTSTVTNIKSGMDGWLIGGYANNDVAIIGVCGYYWSSTRANSDNGYRAYVYDDSFTPQNSHPRGYGYTLRCVKDE